MELLTVFRVVCCVFFIAASFACGCNLIHAAKTNPQEVWLFAASATGLLWSYGLLG